MSKLSLISIGKLPEEYKEIFKHYMHLLSNNITVIEIIIKKNIIGPNTMEAEGDAILNKIEASNHVILLDVKGKKYNSEKFASLIENSLEQNKKTIFIIGGAYGISDKIKARANIIISFSDLTFSHMLARIILLEQIYRAKSIISGHPYHK